jgi:hypothetical protein
MDRQRMIAMVTEARAHYDALLADNVIHIDRQRRARSERKRKRCDEIIAYLRAEAGDDLG